MVKSLEELKGYQIVGKHSAVKTCLWLKKSLKDQGYCYKQKFYGIASHRCLQMSPALICNFSCIHCWRPLNLMPPFESWDEPEFIFEESIKAQQRLLSGFHGTEGVNKKKLREAYEPNQVAISLIGEPTIYPKIAELVEIYNKNGFTTFLVTNGTNPDAVEAVSPYQLYLSITAWNEESHRRLQNAGLWDRIEKTMKIMSEKDTKTVIRLTLIKGINMEPEKFLDVINAAQPEYIEAKAYMHLGHSRLRLSRDAMPEHDEVRAFAERLAKLSGYEIKDESEISRVILLER
ncbi:4-demethylwyosine synthase TYW1 [Geoglobus acetivorans]|uniref:S-adenosyl-L-methionine-dependent tRNA 4-demethylwyosine synthase n=1 Tax=Geoglobus acetivorans TaxID=565033 RepID=A0ABZ3H2J5_GEOAI|nr:4-demethylwyosine synthase TYW1 [Geoglobus acetivorans]